MSVRGAARIHRIDLPVMLAEMNRVVGGAAVDAPPVPR